MSQFDYIKEIAKFGLDNDQEKLKVSLNELIEYARKTKKTNLALQLQSILKEGIRQQKIGHLSKTGSVSHFQRLAENETDELILENLTSDYTFENLVCHQEIQDELHYFIKEHQSAKLLQSLDLPIANKILFHGPSGCGKTLASYVVAGELKRMMMVINLGAIVSSKLGETSKNLSKIFKRAASEDSIIFLDEFDSLGKIRDYSQDHGEMKRVVNTILQLFDYLPQSTIVIAATNQANMLDESLMRRFDVNINFKLPDINQIKALVDLTMKNGAFAFNNKNSSDKVLKETLGLSYYSIQKTLITAMKRSLYQLKSDEMPNKILVDTHIWLDLIKAEKKSLSI
ncbi:AAA family ATPase [Anditalea andensis]|uniref:ATPase AAA n=1 Tax=Anditalea andensis TaxID=1048983 RepID=A0A074KP16_9BACT|nr:ATP-binding protein [Anditalea andensis]KEO71666.1 ATPase AAA [Anditalea andensis]